MRRRSRTAVSVAVVLVVLVVVWEGYKALGQATGVELGVRTNDRAMPHVWDVVAALGQPARRGGEDVLLVLLLEAAVTTWRTAAVGFVVGGLGGFGLGLLLVRYRVVELGCLPYVVASQTVPVIAIAPILITWSRRAELPTWVPIAVVAAYLSFYPVAIAAVRGLRSPEPTAHELMRSYAASGWQTLRMLQLPAALPFLFPALKVAATASVVGAIVGELPAGQSDGLGREILGFASSFSSAPEKLFASVGAAALLGLTFVGVVVVVERVVMAGRTPGAAPAAGPGRRQREAAGTRLAEVGS